MELSWKDEGAGSGLRPFSGFGLIPIDIAPEATSWARRSARLRPLWVAEATHETSAFDGDQPEDLAAGPRALSVGMALL